MKPLRVSTSLLPKRRSRRLIALALAISLTTQATPSATETVGIESAIYENSARIALKWQKPVDYSVFRICCSEQVSDLLIRFDRPLGDMQVAAITSELRGWVDGVRTGYDTLLLEARKGVQFAVTMDGTQLNIDLTSTRGGQPAADSETITRAAQENPVRLQLAFLKTRLLLAVGAQETASRLLQAEARRYPNNPRVMAALADVENQAGRWRKALELYDRALMLRPWDEDIILARRSIARDHAPYLKQEAEYVRSGSDRRYGLRLSGQTSVTKGVGLGFAYEARRTEARNVRRSDGRILDFDGSRMRGELFAVGNLINGRRLQGSLFFGEETIGVGVALALPDFLGTTHFEAELNRPSWEFNEGFVDRGVRNQIGLLRDLRLTPRLSAQAAAFTRTYGVSGDNSVARSFALEGGVRYLVLPESPNLTIGYRFDAEYRRSVDIRFDQTGAAFKPIPLVSREVHALEVTADFNLTNNWGASTYAGFGVDRFSDSGFFGGVEVAHIGDGPLEARMFAESGFSSSDTSERTIRLGFSLKWRF